MIAIIDYQAGNQTSVRRALASLGIESEISDDPARLMAADGVIFPGVGAAGQAMGLLTSTALAETVVELARSRPFLGICLGCQIMLESSEEDGGIKTLGLLPGRNLRFSTNLKDEAGQGIRIPHMGWNNVRPVKTCPILEGIKESDQFYFVHGYYPEPAGELVLATTDYGLTFASVFGRDGLWATQFHPEKSGRPGLKLLKNFHEYCQRRLHGDAPTGAMRHR